MLVLPKAAEAHDAWRLPSADAHLGLRSVTDLIQLGFSDEVAVRMSDCFWRSRPSRQSPRNLLTAQYLLRATRWNDPRACWAEVSRRSEARSRAKRRAVVHQIRSRTSWTTTCVSAHTLLKRSDIRLKNA